MFAESGTCCSLRKSRICRRGEHGFPNAAFRNTRPRAVIRQREWRQHVRSGQQGNTAQVSISCVTFLFGVSISCLRSWKELDLELTGRSFIRSTMTKPITIDSEPTSLTEDGVQNEMLWYAGYT